MHLKQHPGVNAGILHRCWQAHHGAFYDICRTALDRCIDRLTFGKTPLRLIAAGDAIDVNAPAKQGLDISRFTGLGLDIVHIGADAGKILEIGSDIVTRLTLRNAQLAGQAETRDAVDDAKIDRLCAPPCFTIHGIQRDTKYLGGRARVDIHALLERLDHRAFTRHMGNKAQFNLRIVGRNQLAAGRRHKGGSDLPALGCANGNILNIRIG